MSTMLDLTIVIPAKNAQAHLKECLASIPAGFAKRIVVIDSGSTDGTAVLTATSGAELIPFQWDGKFPKKRNWFLRNHPPETRWVLFLDADEVLTPAFRGELQATLPRSDKAGYWLHYTIHFLGGPLRGGYPLKKLALFRVGAGEYERIEEDRWSALDMEVHEHPVIAGEVGEIRARIDHRETTGIHDFVAKHNEYSSWEASRLFLEQRSTARRQRWTWKQRAKSLIVGTPLSGPIYFLGSFVLLGGFLDGTRGLLFAMLKGAYFNEVHCKLRELRAAQTRGTDAPRDLPLLGIRIADITPEQALRKASDGGLILAPSAPGLCTLERDAEYREALRRSDLNLADSGLAILLMRMFGLGGPRRLSGLGFLREIIGSGQLAHGGTFWVMPSLDSARTNLRWLGGLGIPITMQDYHIAPTYPRKGAVTDEELLGKLLQRRPSYIFLCTGSGSQEKLGHWLMEHLDYRPCIAGIGAAIAFLSGDQTPIPRWADRACIGWLLRILSDPACFFPRYLAALRLVPLVLRYGPSEPPLNTLSCQ